MLESIPSHRPQRSLVYTCGFALFAAAIFAIPMLNIVPIPTLLAQAPTYSDKEAPPAATATTSATTQTAPSFEFLPERTDAEKNIELILSANLDEPLDLHETTLSEAVEYLASTYKINIHIDAKALADEGIDSHDKPMIDLSISNVKVETALKLILLPLDLTYQIRNEVITITTEKTIAAQRDFYIYPVGDLAPSLDSLRELTGTLSMISQLNQEPDLIQVNSTTRSLILRHNYQSHLEVLNLLRNLRKIAAAQNYPPYSPVEKFNKPQQASKEDTASGFGGGGGGLGGLGGGFGGGGFSR
ncbi:MAG: hypothetical protein KDA68_10780 [Planctomycetaceae bacterium]|nr:hypothetical protein [Planctomycetaceae bacterium]